MISWKDKFLHEIRYAVGDGSTWIPRKRTIHIDAIEGRNPLICDAGTFAQLWYQDHLATQLGGIQVTPQALGGDLPLPFIPVSAAKHSDPWRS